MSKARSPRDVCSITIGTSGLMQAPCYRGSTTSSAVSGFSFSGVQSLSRASRELHRDPLDLGGEPVERPAQTQVGAQRLVAPALPDLPISSSASSPSSSACSRISASTSSSETSSPSLSAAASSTISRASDRRASRLDVGLDLLRRAVAQLQVSLRADAAPLERADERIPELDRARLDERRRRPRLSVASTSASTRGGPELGFELLLELAAKARLDLPRSSSSVSNSVAALASSSSTGGSTFSWISLS